jgi:hypothetical protein
VFAALARGLSGQRLNEAISAISLAQELKGEAVAEIVAATVYKADPDLAVEFVTRELSKVLAASEEGSEFNVALFLSQIIRTSSSSDVSQVLDRIQRLTEPLIAPAIKRAVEEWSTKDPVAAANWSLDNANHLAPEQFLRVGKQLGRVDPDLAVQIMFKLPNSARDAWAKGVTRGVIEIDVERARSLVTQSSFGQFANTAIRELLLSHADKGTFDANLFQLIDNGVGRQETASIVAARLAGSGNKDLALRIVNEHISDQLLREEAERRIGAGGTRSQSTMLEAALEFLPEGPRQ